MTAVYQLMANFELYQFHQTQYNGTFGQCLRYYEEISQALDEMLFSEHLRSALQKEKAISGYNPFTSRKYLEKQRFTTAFFPNLCVFFLNRLLLRMGFLLMLRALFFRVRQFEVSRFIRIYSFPLFALEYLFLGEIGTISFVALHSFRLLSVETDLWMSYWASISFAFLFGLLFISIASLVFFYRSLYG